MRAGKCAPPFMHTPEEWLVPAGACHSAACAAHSNGCPNGPSCCSAQEELEEKLEKYATRRLPLGFDRHQRRYWWGLAGHRPVVWVEDAEVCGCCLFQTSCASWAGTVAASG